MSSVDLTLSHYGQTIVSDVQYKASSRRAQREHISTMTKVNFLPFSAGTKIVNNSANFSHPDEFNPLSESLGQVKSRTVAKIETKLIGRAVVAETRFS